MPGVFVKGTSAYCILSALCHGHVKYNKIQFKTLKSVSKDK